MNPYYSQIKDTVSDRYLLICLLLVAFYTIIFTFFSIQKHEAFYSGIDLAVYEQVLWSTINQGTFFSCSLEGVSTFGVHFSPILFSLIPFYLIHPETGTLFLLQSLLLGIAAIPLFYLARNLINDAAGIILVCSYLMYPALHGVNLTDFHVVCFAPVFCISAFYFLKQERFRLFLLFVLLLACTREDLIPISIMISLYGAWQAYRSKRACIPYLILAGALTLWFIMVIALVMPALLPEGSSQGGHIYQYQDTLEGLSQYQNNRITHALLLFSPLLLLPLFSPEILFIGISGFLEIFLSPSPFYFSIEYQYSALVIPWLFIGTAMTLARIKNSDHQQISRLCKPFLYCLLLTGIIAMLLFSPSPLRSGPFAKSYDPTVTDHDAILNSLLASIPRDVAVGTQDDILPHISKRAGLYRGFNKNAAYIIADNQTKFIDIFQDSAHSLASWEIIYSQAGITIFKNPSLTL